MSRRYLLSRSVLASLHLLDPSAVHQSSASGSSRSHPHSYQVSSYVTLSLQLTAVPALMFLWCVQLRLVLDSPCEGVCTGRYSGQTLMPWLLHAFQSLTAVITACGGTGWDPCPIHSRFLTSSLQQSASTCGPFTMLCTFVIWTKMPTWTPLSPAFLPFNTVSNPVCWER